MCKSGWEKCNYFSFSSISLIAETISGWFLSPRFKIVCRRYNSWRSLDSRRNSTTISMIGFFSISESCIIHTQSEQDTTISKHPLSEYRIQLPSPGNLDGQQVFH